MTVNTYNNFYTMFILLHVTLFITHCTNFIQTTSSPPVDHEYYIQEEVSIGTLIGNLMNDVVLKYAELGLLKISHKLGQLPDDSDEYYTLKIVNFADPYVNLFEIKTDGRLIVNRRLDRDQICSGQPQLDSSIITGEQTQSVSNIYSNLRQQTNIQAESTSCPIILQIGLFTHHKNSMTSKLETDIKEKKQNRLFYIRINIQDINDNAPYWQGHLQRFRITFLDGDPVGSRRNIPPAIDIDAGSNGHITYELSSANLFDKSPIPFSLLEDSTDGLHLYATKPVDREEQSEYKLMLKAIDGSYTPSTSTSSVLSNESNLKRFTSTLYLDVLIEDVNDNTPQFTQPIFTTAMPIPETTPVGTTILILNATDLDSGINGIYHFGFSKDHYWQPNEKIARHYFDIRPNGQIIVRQPLNVDKLDLNINHNKNNNNNPMLSNLRIRQQLNDDISMHNSKGVNLQFRFRAIVEDEATRPYTRSSEATVIILVTDENDESPIITVRHNPEAINTNTLDSVSLPNPFSYFSVFENQPIGTVVASIQVYDPDFGGQDQVECNLKDANFSLTRHAAQNKPDYDQNNAANSLTEYHLVTSRILDRESTTHQIVTVICSDMVGHYTERNITIRIMDENDNPPKFSHDTFHLQVDENAPVGTLVRQQIQKNTRGHFNNIYQNGLSQWLQATDLDTGINSEMKYFLLEDGVNSTRFKIDSLTGIITTLDVFDREVKDTYTLNVVAVDQGTPQLTGTATLQITINDLNDNGPIFSQNDYTFHIQENQPRSTIVGQVSATDLDSSLFAPLEYSITDDQESVNFTIDKITGIIRSRQSLDREEKSHYAFRVLVKDTRMRLTEVSNSLSGSHGNSINSPLPMNIRYTGTTTVTVIVDDVNDNWPVFISPNSTANTLAIAIDQKVTGYKLAYIQAYDKDDGENGLIRYSILAGNNYGLFGLDSTSGLLYLSNPINQKDSNKDNMLHNSSSDASLSNDGYDVMHILQKSSMHILTLEACDHGKDPKPRCTLYNNLKIIIQNNRENNINNMENTQSQYSLFGQVINIPETLGSSSSSSATSEKSSLSMMQANYDNNQNHLNSIQELNDDSVYQNPTALPYGNLLSNKQSYKTLGYTANDIMIICLSLIFSLVLIATLVLICLVRRRVTWFKSKDKNSVKSEPVSQWGNQTVCQTSLINNQNIPPYGSNKLPGSTSENTSSICHSPEEFSKSATNNKNNTSSNNNDFNGNFISLQNSLHKSLLLPEESGSSRSIYHYTTSLPPTLVTQTQTTMPMATTIDYKRYGCNTHEMNNKFHQLKTSTTGNNGDVFNTLTTARKSNENNITCNNKFDDYQTLNYLGLVSSTFLNKPPVSHKNLGLVTYSPRVMNMPRLVPITSGELTVFNPHGEVPNEKKQSFTPINYNHNLDDSSSSSSYQIAHFHSQSQPQSMNGGYKTLPTFSNSNQIVQDINSTFVPAYNQYPNNVNTYNFNNTNHNKVGNMLLPYQVMATSIINLNNWNYPKYPSQSHTYYDIRQPDIKRNKSTMIKSKSQQLPINAKHQILSSDINEKSSLMETSANWDEIKTTGITSNTNDVNNKNSVLLTEFPGSWNDMQKCTSNNTTVSENWITPSEHNFHSHNNSSFTANITPVSATVSTANTTMPADEAHVTSESHVNNKDKFINESHSSNRGKQKELKESGKYMSAALRESSFV